jgi:hypothetical protein
MEKIFRLLSALTLMKFFSRYLTQSRALNHSFGDFSHMLEKKIFCGDFHKIHFDEGWALFQIYLSKNNFKTFLPQHLVIKVLFTLSFASHCWLFSFILKGFNSFYIHLDAQQLFHIALIKSKIIRQKL